MSMLILNGIQCTHTLLAFKKSNNFILLSHSLIILKQIKHFVFKHSGKKIASSAQIGSVE